MATPNTKKYAAEELIPALTEVPKLLPKKNGKRIHRSTVARWLTKGVDGVRLEGSKAGRTWMTTPAALKAFTTALAKRAAEPTAVVERAVEPTARRHARAAAELDAAGL